MNGKSDLVARVLESVRQRHLTKSLGQVVCDDWHHEPDVMVFGSCMVCGAVI